MDLAADAICTALSDQRGKTLRENRRLTVAGARLRANVSPVLAVEDANLYLYSGRMAISPSFNISNEHFV